MYVLDEQIRLYDFLSIYHKVNLLSNKSGGGEIRTLERVAPLPPFQGGALDRYATPPMSLILAQFTPTYLPDP